MRQMKEKLVKNHYKGFDKRVKIASYVSLGLLVAAVCTLLPLTAAQEYSNYQAQASAKVQQNSSSKGLNRTDARVEITIAE
jgi:hypothetical protein